MNVQPIAFNAIVLTLRNGDKYEVHDAEDGKLIITSAYDNDVRPEFKIHKDIMITRLVGQSNYVMLRIVAEGTDAK